MDSFFDIGEPAFHKDAQGTLVPDVVWPENTPSLPCDGLQCLTNTGEWRAKQPYLILITRLPQRGSHLAVHLASWDKLTSAIEVRDCDSKNGSSVHSFGNERSLLQTDSTTKCGTCNAVSSKQFFESGTSELGIFPTSIFNLTEHQISTATWHGTRTRPLVERVRCGPKGMGNGYEVGPSSSAFVHKGQRTDAKWWAVRLEL